ncbi:MAG: hypothetical protein ABJD68_07080 [Nakamurella sp.]
MVLNARAVPSGDPSVISQIAAAVFGGSSVVFYLFQAATAAILILAANRDTPAERLNELVQVAA